MATKTAAKKTTKPVKKQPVKVAKKEVKKEVKEIPKKVLPKIKYAMEPKFIKSHEDTLTDIYGFLISTIQKEKGVGEAEAFFELIKIQEKVNSTFSEKYITEVEYEETAPEQEKVKPTIPNWNDDKDKVFVLAKDAHFLNGDLKTAFDDTKIKRVSDIDFEMWGEMAQGAPFIQPFKAIDLADAENFWSELCEYELNPSKYTKSPSTETTQTADVTSKPVQETAQPTQFKPKGIAPIGEVISETVKAETIKKFEGVPLNEVNIQELINVAPVDTTTFESPKKSLGKPADISHIVNNKIINDMQNYGESIVSMIHAKSWCKMSQSEVNSLLTNQTSKDYSYKLEKDEKGYYLTLTKDDKVVRSPKDPTQYLLID